jgi:histidinol-phosphate/aromatic aminotransferase/cobyric acid decarboxylase-like protein
VSLFPRSDYRALTRYAPDRRDVALDLSDNTNLWGTHPAALARVRGATTDDLARYPEPYADELRDAVAERFGVAPDCVTTGAGSDDTLDSAFRAAAAPGATVRYATPTFSMVGPLALMNGMRPEGVPWAEALADPTRLLDGDPALVYVCRPNNPTGACATLEWVERLLAARSGAAGRLRPGRAGGAGRGGNAHGPLVVLDEAYGDFADSTLVAWAPTRPGLLVTRTTSKAYGLAGLRCGFGVGSAEVALEIEKSRGPYKVSRLAAAAAAVAIRDREGWMASTVAACVACRRRLHDELVARRLHPLASQANFILFAAPSGSAGDDARALLGLGVAVRPFEEIPELGQALRVTVGPWPMMETFLGVLDRYLDALPAADGRRARGESSGAGPVAFT